MTRFETGLPQVPPRGIGITYGLKGQVMRHAEEVTFGGAGLDRAAELRGDIPALAAGLHAADARTVVLWRGKPLVTGADTLVTSADTLELVRLRLDHPVLAEARADPVLLGREDAALRFAHDISAWEPAGLDRDALGRFVDTSEQVHPKLAEGDSTSGARFAELRAVMTRLSPRDAELAATAKALHGWHASHGFCARCGSPSHIAQAGWQRICPKCGGHHFPRTDPVVIMLVTHGNRVLLGRSPGWPEGMYSCLAGFVEPGETIEAAVRREVFEEAGVRVGAVRYLASQPWAFPSSLMIGCLGEARDTAIAIDPTEIEDAIWVSREDITEAFAGRNPGVLPARKGAIAEFLLRNWLADRLE